MTRSAPSPVSTAFFIQTRAVIVVDVIRLRRFVEGLIIWVLEGNTDVGCKKYNLISYMIQHSYE